jgi:hypothetical protein
MIQVIRRDLVARSLARLREEKTHTLFAGYLHLQQQTCILRRLDDLRPDFTEFYKRFFAVENHPLGTPYVKPFTEQNPSPNNLWLNENIAGSYAPSSLRPNQPFRQVVDIVGRTYSLPIDHADRAFTYLLYKRPVQVADLAVFLYRDYGLLEDSPQIGDLVDMFAYEFGYSSMLGGETKRDFSRLYSTESARRWDGDWLETA